MLEELREDLKEAVGLFTMPKLFGIGLIVPAAYVLIWMVLAVARVIA
ncbi:MAG: hypothetical protein ACYCX4_14460 [Bacillota bacterium]